MTTINLNDKVSAFKTSTKDGVKKAYKATVSGLGKGLNYTKTLAQDSFNYVKTNPKKVGKYAAMGVLAGVVIGGAAKLIQNAVNSYKQTKLENQLLKATVLAEKETIETMENIVDTKNEQIDVLSETVQDLNQKLHQEK